MLYLVNLDDILIGGKSGKQIFVLELNRMETCRENRQGQVRSVLVFTLS